MELTNDFRVALPVDRAWAVLTDLERIAPCMPGAQLQEVEGDDYRGIVKIKVGPITAQYKGQATFVSQDADKHVAVLRAEGRETRGQGNANATITATLTPDGAGTAVSVVTDLVVTGRVAQFGRGVLAEVSAKLLDQFVTCLETTVLADEPAPAPVAAAAAGDAGQGGEAATSGAAGEPDATPTAEAAADAASGGGAADEAGPAGAGAEAAGGAGPAGAGAEAASGTGIASGAGAVETAAAPERPAVRKIDSPEPEPVDLVGAAGSPVAKRVGPVLAIIAVVWLLKKLLGRKK
jgi:hypothetical protein